MDEQIKHSVEMVEEQMQRQQQQLVEYKCALATEIAAI